MHVSAIITKFRFGCISPLKNYVTHNFLGIVRK